MMNHKYVLLPFSCEQSSSGNSDPWSSVYYAVVVLTNISSLRGWNATPLSTTHLQLLHHLSVCFSDCRISTTCPLPCCHAQDNRCCFLTDPFLCLNTEVFMGQSAEFSLGAEANIWVSSAHKFERSLSDFKPGTMAAAASAQLQSPPPLPGRDEAWNRRSPRAPTS